MLTIYKCIGREQLRLDYFDHFNRLIKLTIIAIRSFHCIWKQCKGNLKGYKLKYPTVLKLQWTPLNGITDNGIIQILGLNSSWLAIPKLVFHTWCMLSLCAYYYQLVIVISLHSPKVIIIIIILFISTWHHNITNEWNRV